MEVSRTKRDGGRRDAGSTVRGFLGGLDPKKLSAAVLVAFMLSSVVLSWRYVAARDRAPLNYYDFQIERWQQQLIENPEDPLVWSTLGGLFAEMGDDGKAEKAFARALEADPDCVPARLYHARRARDSGDLERARDLYLESLDLIPEAGRFLVSFELGELELDRGNTAEAIAAFEESAEANPGYYNAYSRLAFLYEQTGEPEKALAAAEAAQKFAGGDQEDLADLVIRLAAHDGAAGGSSVE